MSGCRRPAARKAGSTAVSASSATSGGDGLRFKPQIGEINLAWQPRFSWSLSATVVGTLQGGERPEAGIEQAYVSFRPMRGERHRFSARAGLLWPSVSLRA